MDSQYPTTEVMTDDDIVEIVREEEEPEQEEEDVVEDLTVSDAPPTSGQIVQCLDIVARFLKNKPNSDGARAAVDTLRELTLFNAESLKYSQRSALFLLLNKCLLYNEIPCYCYEILIFVVVSLTVMYIGRSSI